MPPTGGIKALEVEKIRCIAILVRNSWLLYYWAVKFKEDLLAATQYHPFYT